MAIPALKCSALTELTTDVQISNIDAEGLTVSGDGVSHKFYHSDVRRYNVQALMTANRVVIKQMIKKVSFVAFYEFYFLFRRFMKATDFTLWTSIVSI
jgi:hypothetical protein